MQYVSWIYGTRSSKVVMCSVKQVDQNLPQIDEELAS